MTTPTDEAAPTSAAPVAQAQRTPRQAPTDLTMTFTDEASLRAQSGARGEPEWLLADRLAALARFDALPIEANRLYTTYIDLRTAKLGDVVPYATPASSPEPGREAAAPLPEGADGFIELREDGVAALALSGAAQAAGVVLETFGSALRNHPESLRSHLEGASLLPDDDKLASLTRAFWNQGVLLQVPDGVRLERPIVIRWAVGAPDRGLLTRTLVSLGEDAGLSLVEELEASEVGAAAGSVPGAGQAFFAGTTEVVLGRGATLSVASLQDFPPNVVAFEHRFARIGQAASVHWALAQLGTRLIRSRVDNRLEGDNSSVEQVEIVFGGGDQVFDLTSYTHHVGRDTTGNLLSKGALQDAARSYMKGLITIDRSAIGTDSFLGEFGMNLSKETRSVAIPSLEIDQPDCRRAAHASSVGPIDESQLFYLETRGIPPDEARKFIVLGFLEPVVARVPLAEAQDRLRELLEEKWAAGRRSAVA
jgi:Fe-S cluster assembly scaffold protein SufB